jgi:hypothetical protein
MGALRTGQGRRLAWWRCLCRSLLLHVQPLAAKPLHTGPAMLSPAPISPEQGSRTDAEGMEQQTHAARVRGSLPVPLTLLTQGARTTRADVGLIDDTQAAITFPAPFGCREARPSRTAQRAVGLERKVRPREAARFPGQSRGSSSIPGSRGAGRSPILRGRLQGWRELGGAQRLRLSLMAQFQAEVPDPLRNDLPRFLASERMTTPASRVLLLVADRPGLVQRPHDADRARRHRQQ